MIFKLINILLMIYKLNNKIKIEYLKIKFTYLDL